MAKGITAEALALRFPRLYQMAEEGSWPGIERHGLLSNTALLDLFGVRGSRRERLESTRRPESVAIEHPIHGRAIIRDQKPLDEAGLRRSLRDGLTPRDWYRILNRKVFFWLTRERLDRLLNARAARDKRHTVIVLDTARLLARHSREVVLSPINSGCTKPYPQERGLDTFLPLESYPFEDWDRRRRGTDPVVELAVDYAVPAIRELCLSVTDVAPASAPAQVHARHPR